MREIDNETIFKNVKDVNGGTEGNMITDSEKDNECLEVRFKKSNKGNSALGKDTRLQIDLSHELGDCSEVSSNKSDEKNSASEEEKTAGSQTSLGQESKDENTN